MDILQLYSAFEKSARPKRPGSAEADIFEEVLSGIKIYFDRCLGNILLYRFERQQYVDVRRSNDGKEMSEIYGAEHLLRLFGTPTLVIFLCSLDISLFTWFDCAYQHGSTEHTNSQRPYWRNPQVSIHWLCAKNYHSDFKIHGKKSRWFVWKELRRHFGAISKRTTLVTWMIGQRIGKSKLEMYMVAVDKSVWA